MNDKSDDYYYIVIHAHQGGMAVGRSIVTNLIFNQAAQVRCWFEAVDEEDGEAPRIDSEPFLISAGSGGSLETLSGVARSGAERALQNLNNRLRMKGCERIANGPHWYNYRYRVHVNVVDRWS